MVLDETLRMYPPAWIGPRRSIEPFELCGVRVPGGVMVNYCSWASHHLPEVFPEPSRFRPSRFAPEAKAALPKGAYVPFGGGSRTCIGMRFGQLEVKEIARAVLRRYVLDLEDPATSPRSARCRPYRHAAGFRWWCGRAIEVEMARRAGPTPGVRVPRIHSPRGA
jgi:cytochrome P450